jgi:preprotein translocase subunit SecA
VDNAVLRREIARAQRIVEGQDFEIRRTLWRYAEVVEGQRRTLHEEREAVLHRRRPPARWRGDPRWSTLAARAGEDALQEAERAATLAALDQAWREHLAFVAEVREGIHLVRLGGDDPLTRFRVLTGEAFRELHHAVDEAVMAALERVDPAAAGLGLDASAGAPASTWTYLVNDDPFRDLLGSQLTGPGRATLAVGAAVFAMPLLIALGLVDRYLRRRPARR